MYLTLTCRFLLQGYKVRRYNMAMICSDSPRKTAFERFLVAASQHAGFKYLNAKIEN